MKMRFPFFGRKSPESYTVSPPIGAPPQSPKFKRWSQEYATACSQLAETTLQLEVTLPRRKRELLKQMSQILEQVARWQDKQRQQASVAQKVPTSWKDKGKPSKAPESAPVVTSEVTPQPPSSVPVATSRGS